MRDFLYFLKETVYKNLRIIVIIKIFLEKMRRALKSDFASGREILRLLEGSDRRHFTQLLLRLTRFAYDVRIFRGKWKTCHILQDRRWPRG